MATYVLLSMLTDEGAKTIKKNPHRIKEVDEEMRTLGIEVLSQYVLLGPYDFLTVVEAPDNETMVRVSAEMAARGTIKVQTLSAIPVEKFIASFK